MEKQNVDKQVRIQLFDLMNIAQEHGFKAEDKWEVNLMADDEKAVIQHQYYPAVVTRMFPDTILDVFHAIKTKLNQPLNPQEQAMDIPAVLKQDLRYLVAYNLKRPRN